MSWNKYVVSENDPETEATPLSPEDKQAVAAQVNTSVLLSPHVLRLFPSAYFELTSTSFTLPGHLSLK